MIYHKILEKLELHTIVRFDYSFIDDIETQQKHNKRLRGIWEFIGTADCEWRGKCASDIARCPGYLRFKKLSDGEIIEDCFSHPQPYPHAADTPIVIITKPLKLPDELFEI